MSFFGSPEPPVLEEIQENYTFRLPPSTPASVPYPNLVNSTQHARNNFQPKKRHFKRTISAQENETSLKFVLKKHWGHDQFRTPQLEVCMSVMRGCDVLVVAPTGLGKSVCFQVPAIALKHGITLVVSPLLSLMKDQVTGLRGKNIPAAVLCQDTPWKEEQEIRRQLRMGHPDLRLLYLTPESLFSPKYQADLLKCHAQRQMMRLVVDEAHVIDEWGMTFRKAYRELGNFRLHYPGIPITALTASATEEVRTDITNILCIPRKDLAQWVLPFNRKNLFYEVRYRGTTVKHKSKEDDIADFIVSYRPVALKRNAANGVKTGMVSGLVYCRSRGTCEIVAGHLRERGIKAAAFHAQLNVQVRNALLDDWKRGKIECIVATIAFGMGVDQAHVRYVVHFDLPKSFEGFYQETGRAGRDGHASKCILYYAREDANRVRNLIQKDADDSEASDLMPGDANHTGNGSEIRQAKMRCLNSFKWLQQYAEATGTCRHVSVCRYFGEKIDDSNDEVQAAYCAAMCDICVNKAAVRRRANNVSENVEIASQIVRVPRSAPASVHETSSSASGPINSLALLHGSDAPGFSSDTSGPITRRGPTTRRAVSLRTSGLPISMPAASTPGPTPFQVARATSPVESLHSEVPLAYTEHIHSSPHDPAPASHHGEMGPASPIPSCSLVAESPGPRNASAGPSRLRDRTPVLHTPAPARPSRAAHTPDNTASRTRQSPSSVTRTSNNFDVDPAAGGYAVAGRMPLDPRKRQRQEDAFMAIQPATARAGGPFPCYSVSTPGSRATSQGISHHKRFKTPFLRQAETMRIATITEPTRKQGVKLIREALKKLLLLSEVADQVWAYWGRAEMGGERKQAVKDIGAEMEAEVIAKCEVEDTVTPHDYDGNISALCDMIRALRSTEAANSLIGGRFMHDFGEDEGAEWVLLLERCVRHRPDG